MRYILTKMRRVRRSRRIPHGLLVAAVMAVLVLTMTLSMSLIAIPASAEMRDFRMPRTDSGVVTDHDGIIQSGDMLDTSDAKGTEAHPDSNTTNNGTDILDPNTTDTAGGTTTDKAPVTSNAVSDMVDDVANGTGMAPWVVGLIILAVVIGIIILIVWWVSGSRRRR